MLKLFKMIAEDKEDSDKILVTCNKMNTFYKTKLDVEISNPTIRNYGFCQGGYFTTKYPNVFSYKDDGPRKYRGMVINLEAFKDKIGVEYEEKEE